MSETALQKAIDFIENQKQFHLGFLPTEQSNPLTANLDKEFASSTVAGVANLQSVDRNVAEMAKKIFVSPEFAKLVDDGEKVIRNGGKIVFSGCGATGRLSILLESMWRSCCAAEKESAPYADQVFSIMTGGDYALVRSVESFEDYQQFGRRQAQELAINANDMLVAITEGGETSSVLGSLFEAVERDAKAFLLFNNPAQLLADNLERSRRAICDPRVCVLDLYCGPMALAGSTRMQATTSEQLVAGGALEMIMARLTGRSTVDYADAFEKLLDKLEAPSARNAIAEYIDFEVELYRKKGLVTYFANDYMLDIFTDTTERSPTFMLPPFRKKDDSVSPRPWAFVKNPLCSTAGSWQKSMHRPLRCLEWTKEDYIQMDAPAKVCDDPPQISSAELLKFETGMESIDDRTVTGNDAAVLITVGSAQSDDRIFPAFAEAAEKFNSVKHLALTDNADADFVIPCEQPASQLNVMRHMAVKLVLNTISTGVMAVLGRVSGNWMSWVNVSNKKLMDRGIRLIADLGKTDYRTACIKIFEAVEKLDNEWDLAEEKPSAVQYVLKELQAGK